MMVKVLLWAAVILLISYLFNINPVAIIQDITHAAQTVHNSH
jgi:hypothetical protein